MTISLAIASKIASSLSNVLRGQQGMTRETPEGSAAGEAATQGKSLGSALDEVGWTPVGKRIKVKTGKDQPPLSKRDGGAV
ncbi:hypothetical protein [Neorhizobium alkalisoli]|nr:hypothetical protein [Neorhizobium alkalisoli]